MRGIVGRWIHVLKALGWTVIALMALAIVYAAVISLRYWPAISV
jgi:hypothetical protein